MLCLLGYTSYAQLGFCGGNSGDPIFVENFGTGTSNNALPTGTTTYNYASGFPNDGFYTVSNGTIGNGFDWHQIPDHTPGDNNGKCLIVNAEFSAGEFYRTTVSGLCEATTYEFSAWLVNLVIAGSFCSTQPSGTIPINVRFEIWDSTDINLLASGNTGNIIETSTPSWEEYGLVFQTLTGQDTVILKMINNGQGGCGNDLAIDDIEFKSCGDAITIEDTSNNGSVSLCSGETPFSTTLTVTPDNSVFSSHFYQWQESTDNNTWLDISGETTETLVVSGVSSTMYYRAKVAESAANLNNSDCITFSDTFEVIITEAGSPPTLECWETAIINNTTCTWEVTGTQPVEPTNLECWETTTFNNTTCVWEVSGTQPTEPANLECWETTTFNTTTCVWDISGTQPVEPTGLECWEMATFNPTTCTWEVSGMQPVEPTNLECWETTTFNTTTCVWDITGTEPIDFLEEDISFCEGDDVILSGNINQLNSTYLWESGETTQEITINEPGTYSVEITSNLCSTTIKTINVTENVIPIIESVISEGDTIIINMLNNGDFEYSLDGIQYQLSNSFNNIDGGLYTIYVRERNGCGVVTFQHLHFKIPKYFTPNGDGVNDVFDLGGIEFFNHSEVYIFDRYGKLIKSSKNQRFIWDGTLNNEVLPNSDYWYYIKIDNQEFRGHFTLKR